MLAGGVDRHTHTQGFGFDGKHFYLPASCCILTFAGSVSICPYVPGMIKVAEIVMKLASPVPMMVFDPLASCPLHIYTFQLQKRGREKKKETLQPQNNRRRNTRGSDGRLGRDARKPRDIKGTRTNIRAVRPSPTPPQKQSIIPSENNPTLPGIS